LRTLKLTLFAAGGGKIEREFGIDPEGGLDLGFGPTVTAHDEQLRRPLSVSGYELAFVGFEGLGSATEARRRLWRAMLELRASFGVELVPEIGELPTITERTLVALKAFDEALAGSRMP